jgi:flavorubredoxin
VKAFVVCESMFGNAEKLPMAVPEGLVAASAEVAVVEVRRAGGQDLMECDLLVVDAPTRAFSLSRPQTRADAFTRCAEPAPDGDFRWSRGSRSPWNVRPV